MRCTQSSWSSGVAVLKYSHKRNTKESKSVLQKQKLTKMKIFCALILFVSSWCSTQGCQLLSNSCSSRQFQTCIFDNACRQLTSLNLANKGLNGPAPAKFNQLYSTNLNGDPDNGIPKVKLTKLELQQNQLVGLIRNLLTPTLTEVYVQTRNFHM